MVIYFVSIIFKVEPLEFGDFSNELDCAMTMNRRLFCVTRPLPALVDGRGHSEFGGINRQENSGADALPTVEAEEGGRPEGET